MFWRKEYINTTHVKKVNFFIYAGGFPNHLIASYRVLMSGFVGFYIYTYTILMNVIY